MILSSSVLYRHFQCERALRFACLAYLACLALSRPFLLRQHPNREVECCYAAQVAGKLGLVTGLGMVAAASARNGAQRRSSSECL